MNDYLIRLITAAVFAVTTQCPVAANDSATHGDALEPHGESVPVLLAVDGAASAAILVPGEPSTQEAKAAEELARWLKEMTGATFEVRRETEDDTPAGRVIAGIGVCPWYRGLSL